MVRLGSRAMRLSTTATLVMLLAVLLVAMPTGAMAHPMGLASAPSTGGFATHAPSGTALAAPSVPISQVVSSLSTGAGPAHGVSVSCTASSDSAARCGVPAMTARPSIAFVGWVNETGSLSYGPAPATRAASLAYDYHDRYYVYYGGCGVTVCPTADTWIYYDGWWENVTGFVGTAPPARGYAAMDYDLILGAVMLWGGCGLTICPLNDTWEYVSGTWTNISASMCSVSCPTAAWGASLVWDGHDGLSVLFGGCTDGICAGTTNQTYENLGSWYLPPISSAPPIRAVAAMVYDPALNVTVLFGGEYSCGLFVWCALNDTWVYSVSNRWVNITALTATPPPARGFGMIAWDNVTKSVILSGGYNPTSITYFTDTWSFSCPFFCIWTNLTATTGPIPRYEAAMAENNSNFAPIVVGGYSTSTFAIDPQMWAYGTPVGAPTVTVTPNPTTYGWRTYINASNSGGTGPYVETWSFQAGNATFAGFSNDTVFTFGRPGTFPMRVIAVDATGMLAATPATVTVNPKPSVSIVASHLTTDVGVSVSLTANVAAGTGLGPFVTNWTTSDGAHLSGASVSHAFVTTGTFLVTVNVTDVAGHFNGSETNITVNAAPAVTASASITQLDVGMQVNFTATGTLGTTPYTYAWSFGDGASGSGATPTHTYSTSGTYHATVTLTDAAGGTASHMVNVTVNSPLTAAITPNRTSALIGATFQFTGAGSGGASPYTYAWTFGDGAVGTGATATHAYAAKGNYTVTLTVTDALGKSTSTTVTVSVASPPSSSSSSGSTLSPLAIGIILIVVVVIIGALVALMMRRRGSGPGPSAGAPPGSAPPSGATGPTPPPGAGGPPGA